MTKTELIDYLNEHVLYELLMLRYSKKRLESCTTDRLLWNAMFAAFNVSARNIYEFLSPSDNTCVRLRDFKEHCGKFERGSIEKVKGTLQAERAMLPFGQTANSGQQRQGNPAESSGGIRVGGIQYDCLHRKPGLQKSDTPGDS